VVKVLKPSTYKPANEDGEELTNAWNIQQLRLLPLERISKSLLLFTCPTPQLAAQM
jgi:hypothetical protein